MGNHVAIRIHGAAYFAALNDEITRLSPGDRFSFLDWRGDADERLGAPGSEIGKVLAEATRRGIAVHGLVWRSHPDEEGFSEEENAEFAEMVNEAGGHIFTDERVSRFGSHHQKMTLLRHPGNPAADVAFVGGIDLCHGRRDDEQHRGDPQTVGLDARFGVRPAWHDAQIELRGPAVGDIDYTFRERWEDPEPTDRIGVLSRRPSSRRSGAQRPTSLGAELPDPDSVGSIDVQILRTYPAKQPAYPFARQGERSVARGYAKALSRARSLVYVEDQYIWSADVGRVFAEALTEQCDLRLIAVVPRFPDRDGLFTGPLNKYGQLEALSILRDAGGDRVAINDIENEARQPIYVHGKLCVIDDVWLAVGSDNLNRRSWTHDSELTCAVVDTELDGRAPVDPGGLGDGARVLARQLRTTLWREHLGEGVPESVLLDPVAGFEMWKRRAEALDEWHANDRRGGRPPGRVRTHHPSQVASITSTLIRPIYRLAIDPDGRPRRLRRNRVF